jgi:purine-cytosine permease-like protein
MSDPAEGQNGAISRFRASAWVPWIGVLLTISTTILVIFRLDHPVGPVLLVGSLILLLVALNQLADHYVRRRREQRRSAAE